MCWNADISLNTFIFGCLVLLFVYITNTYTQYKTASFENSLMYLFYFCVLWIQLMEFFIWKNLKNKSRVQFYSKLIWVSLLLQPFILIFMLQGWVQYVLFFFYFLFYAFLYLLFPAFGKDSDFNTHVGKNGHLVWEFVDFKNQPYIYVVYSMLYIIPCLILKNFFLAIFLTLTTLLSLFFYFKDGLFPTMWCWTSNLLFLLLLIHILIVQPFLKYNGLI